MQMNDFQKYVSSVWPTRFLEKLWRMRKNIEISNLKLPKQKEII